MSNHDAATICNSILEHGIRSTYQIGSLHKFKSYLREILQYSHDELKTLSERHEEHDSGLIKVAEIILGAEDKEQWIRERFDNLREKYSSDTEKQISQFDLETLVVESIDHEVIDAWLNCIHIRSRFEGSIEYIIADADKEIFSITFRYVPNEETDPESIKVNGFIVGQGAEEYNRIRIYEGMQLQRFTGYTQLFKRTQPEKEVAINLNLDGLAGVQVKVPPLKKSSPTPIGSILASILSWPQFVSCVGDDPGFNPETSNWAPCDKRPISSSDLATRFGISHTPDLRGVFLRGLNIFSTDEPYPVPGEQADQGNHRQAGDFQKDDFIKHKHSVNADNQARTGHFSAGDSSGPRTAVIRSGMYTGETGGTETRPKNVAVYYYIKIN
jgi:hypothetical protein